MRHRVFAATLLICSLAPLIWAGKEKSNVDKYIRELGGTDFEVTEAFEKLVNLGESAVPKLLETVQNRKKDKMTRLMSLVVLEHIKPKTESAVSIIAKVAYGDPDEHIRRNSFHVLEEIGTSSVPVLLKGLRHDRADVRERAAYTLSQLGPHAKPALPELIKMLANKNENDFTRAHVASALGAIGPDAKDAVPVLVKTLGERGLIRQAPTAAAWALGKIGPAAKAAIPDLCNAVKSPDPFLAQAAASALSELAQGEKEALPAIVKALKSSSGIARVALADALGKMGANAKEAIPVLMAEIEDFNDTFSVPDFALAAARIDPEQCVKTIPALLKCLQDKKNWITRARAAEVLEAYGPSAREAIPALGAALEDKHKEVREAAKKALKAIGD